MNISVGETVRKAEALGEEQYKKFVEERLVKCEKPITVEPQSYGPHSYGLFS